MGGKRRKISRQDAVYQIALAGISAAVALLFVWLGVLVSFSTVAFFIAAGIALMVPLTKKYYLSSIFAYIVSSALAFVVAGDIYAVVGYIAYFGPISLITGIMCNLKVKWFISVPVKILFINGALALLYFVCHTIVIDASIMEKIDYWVIALVGTVILLAIDFVLQFMYLRLIPIVAKALRKGNKGDSDKPVDDGAQNACDDDEDAVFSIDPFEDSDSPFSDSFMDNDGAPEPNAYNDSLYDDNKSPYDDITKNDTDKTDEDDNSGIGGDD